MTKKHRFSRWAVSLALGAATLGATTVGWAGQNQPAMSKSELVIAMAQDPENWDPTATFLVAWGAVGSNIFDGLVRRDTHLKLQPGLATSWKYTNPTTLAFTLRQGVKFQDGEPFDANAVKFTFDRLSADTKSPQHDNYSSIKSVQVVSPYKVIFHLSSVDPVLITKLAGYGAMIVPPKYIKQHGNTYFGNHPIGTGPFQVVSYKRDNSLLMQANKSYWGGAPKLAKVLIRFIPDPNTRLQEMQAGHVDIVEGVPASQVSQVKSATNFNLDAVGAPTVYSVRFDTALAPANNLYFRQAINYAVDKNAIIQKILNGYGKPISTFQGDISFGNDPNLKAYPYNVAKAKELLKKSGVKPGAAITFDYIGTDATFAEVAQAIQEELQAIGLNVKLQPQDISTFYNTLIPHEKAGQMYESGWGGWTLDFDNTAYLLYHKGEFWNPDFTNPQVEKLLTAERSTNDQSKRAQVFHQMDAVLHQQAIEVPLYQADTIWAVRKGIQGWVTPPDERMDLQSVKFQ